MIPFWIAYYGFSQVVLYMKYGFYTFAIFLIFVQHNGPGDGHPLRTENPPKTPSNLPAEEASWTWGGLWWIQGHNLNPHIKALEKKQLASKPSKKPSRQKQKRIYTYLPASSTGVLKETLRDGVFAVPQTSSIQHPERKIQIMSLFLLNLMV